MLARRHVTYDDYAAFERPCAGELNHMDECVAALRDIRAKTGPDATICVAPDFDMDGIMSAVVLVAGLAELGFAVELFCPDPSAGYGISAAEADRLMAEHPRARWVITCDVGITCRDGVSRLTENGLGVIVTDHHMEPETGSARDLALACVDPCGVDDDYELPGICGATVAWRVMFAYARALADAHTQDNIWRLRVFAGIGCVSDLMPLEHDNRALVRDACSILRLVLHGGGRLGYVDTIDGCAAYRSAYRGLAAVMAAFDEAYPLTSPADVDADFIGFTLAPAFNAARRMGVDMAHAFNVFFGDDESRDLGVRVLMDANEHRKAAVKAAMAALDESEQPWAPCVYVTDAPAGVLGLIASKLLDRSSMPVCVVRANEDGTFSGSGRSPVWYPFLERSKATHVACAGHNGAFGVRFSSADELACAAASVLADAAAMAAVASEASEPELGYDICVDVLGMEGDINLDLAALYEFLHDCEAFAPYGRAWPLPRVRVHVADGTGEVGRMGSADQHLFVRLPYGFKCVCWNQGELADKICGRDFSVTGKLALNTYLGSTSLQLIGDVDGF